MRELNTNAPAEPRKTEIRESHSAEKQKVASCVEFSASLYKMSPRAVAEILIRNINDSGNIILKTEIAGPGFINFFLNIKAWLPFLEQIHTHEAFGACDLSRCGS